MRMQSNRTKLLDMFEAGLLNTDNLVRDLINWLDDAEVKQFCESNDIQLSSDDEDDEQSDYEVDED